jgi:hypothetical protein
VYTFSFLFAGQEFTTMKKVKMSLFLVSKSFLEGSGDGGGDDGGDDGDDDDDWRAG